MDKFIYNLKKSAPIPVSTSENCKKSAMNSSKNEWIF